MAVVVYTVTMTSGQTQPTSGVNLGKDGFDHIVMLFPSMASGSIGMTVSATEDGTYYRHTTTADSALAANGAAVRFHGGGQFIKPHNTSGATDAINVIKIICSRS